MRCIAPFDAYRRRPRTSARSTLTSALPLPLIVDRIASFLIMTVSRRRSHAQMRGRMAPMAAMAAAAAAARR